MKNIKSKLNKILITIMVVFVSIVSLHTIAAVPAGNFWFQFITQTKTGSDNTGDGGTGNPADYNYYYVGQNVNFTAYVAVGNTHPSNTADLRATFDKNILNASNLTLSNAYKNVASTSIDNLLGKITASAYNDTGVYLTTTSSSSYANFTLTMLKPTAYNYGSTSTSLNILYFGPGITAGDSNIGQDGPDYMDSKEDFNMIVWADTKKPYSKNPSPVDGATGVLVTSNYTFDIRDSKNGEGDDSGVGTGFAAPPTGRTVNINNGVATTSYTSLTSHNCSGTWQTLCTATVSPSSPLGISGDTRKWNYNTLYTVQISGYQDRASTNQNQLGPLDTNGPNKIATTTYVFRTESDTTAPIVSARTPSPSATNVSVSTQIVVDVIDIKTTNVSGTGVNPSTCSISINSASTGSHVYTNVSSGVVTSSIPYGYRFTITPVSNFSQNETVYVNTYGCQDLVGNTMATDNFSFTTVDAGAPYIASFSPANSSTVSTSTPIKFVILDSGTGVDFNNTIVYVKGNYYKAGGGAGSVNVSSGIPVNISFSTSTNLTPFATATSTGSDVGYVVTINNLSLSQSESVPVIIYSKDFNNNVMPTYITSFMTSSPLVVVDGSTYCGSGTTWNGSSCISVPVVIDGSTYCGGGTVWNGSYCTSTSTSILGSTYCGNDTVWNGSMCVATSTQILGDGSTYCGGNTTWNGTQCVGNNSGGGGGVCLVPNVVAQLGVFNAFATQINKNDVLITWSSGDMANGEVYYGTSEKDLNTLVKEDTEILNTYHSVVINNLEVGKLYYFKPVSKKNWNTASGTILKMSPVYEVKVVEGSRSPSQNTVSSSYTNICKPVTIIKEINSTNSDSQNNLNINNSDNTNTATSSNYLDNSKDKNPNKFIYILSWILLLLSAVILSIVYFRKHRNPNIVSSVSENSLINNDYKNKIKNMFKNKKVIIVSIVIILFCVSIFVLYKNTNLFSKLFKNKLDNTPKMISVSGSVFDPFTLQGVGGVNLNTANVSIETAPDGNYSFDQINNQDGLKITYPTLNRAVLIDLSQIKTEARMNIYFDANMFNTLNSYLENINSKRFLKATEFLSDSCKEKVSADMLSKENLLFKNNFSSSQTLDVLKTDSVSGWYSDVCQNRFQRVALVSVKTSNKYENFVLTKEGETWKIIK